MYPVTLTVHNDLQLNAIMAALGSLTGRASGTVENAANKPKAETKKPDAAASKPSTGDTKESPASSAPAATGESSGAIDYEKVLKPAALALVAAPGKGREKLIEVSQAAAGVNSPKDAKPEQYAVLLAAINEALAA